MKKNSKGSITATVMVSVAVALIIASSVASIITFQRKAGLRQQLKLHSANAAEAAIDYAYAFIISDAELNGLDQSNYIPLSSGSPKAFSFPTPVLNFLRNKNPLPIQGNDPVDFTDVSVTVMPRPATETRIYINPNDPANASNPNRGQWVYQETIPMVSKVTAKQGGISYTSYARKDINYSITNLFQHAIFYQGQLHLHRGFKVMGSVHTNGNLILNAHDADHAIYNGFVNAGNRFYRGSITDSGGTGMNAYGLVEQLSNGDLDPSKFTTGQTGTGSGTTTSPLTAGDIPIYVQTDASNNYIYRYVEKSYDSRMANWKNLATSQFMGHLEDKSHAVPIINPIGSLGYSQDIAATTTVDEFSNGPYFLIEPILPKTHALRTAANSTKTNYRYNISANASLVLRVEFSARDGAGNLIRDSYNPNLYNAAIPASGWVPYQGATPLPQALNPSNYIVRAYAKPANRARVDDPNDATQRVPIPFPTDVIGRADYTRAEDASSYNYTAGTAPRIIDVIGSEGDLTQAATVATVFPAGTRANPGAPANTNGRVLAEAWHRYRIEPYWALPTVATTAYTTAATTSAGSVLPNSGTPFQKRGEIGVLASQPAAIGTAATASFPLYGLHDARLGRGVHLLTLDISRLKEIMEEPLATVAARFGAEALAFRQAFNNGTNQWNGVIYVEFPTSTTVDTTVINRAPVSSVYYENAIWPQYTDAATNATHRTAGASYLDSHPFQYGSAELRIPLRTSDTTTIANRTDNIVPIAKEFRKYPATVNSQTITDPTNAILALQVINANKLPKVNIAKYDANAGNALSYGFTLGTNAPLYLVGSWNSDGDYTTGTKVTSTNPNDYATVDNVALTGDTNPEIPSAIFCDTLTVLSPGWATQRNYPGAQSTANTTRRQNSFFGWGSDSNTYRQVTWTNANERIEISACIATGEFPVFEFFTHALEDFNKTNGTPCTPLVVKGAMVAMFTSEIQHIKQAYGRDPTKDIQVYWSAHGAHCFPSPRLHKFILDGNFPPATPQALVPAQSNFQVLFPGDALISSAGF